MQNKKETVAGFQAFVWGKNKESHPQLVGLEVEGCLPWTSSSILSSDSRWARMLDYSSPSSTVYNEFVV